MQNLAILVIDDNPDDLEAISRALGKSQQYMNQVILCATPEEGLQVVSSQPLLCVFIDFHFPTQTGLSLLQDIKSIDTRLPVIVITGMADEELAVQLLKAGAHNYITKNKIQVDTLNAAISDALTGLNTRFLPASQVDVPLNILMVDDNKDDREFIRRLLKKSGMRHEISECVSGRQLHQFDLDVMHCVLLDYSLPGETGLSILRRLKSAYPYLAIILVTGQGDESVAVEAIKNGAENYLVKGKLNSDFLEKSIADACEKKSLQRRLAEKDNALKISQSSLDDANKFQSLIFQSLPDFIFVKDSDFKIVRANQAFLSLYPKDMRDSVIGSTTLEAYDQEEAEAFLAMDKKAFASGLSETFETINFPSGEERTLFTTKKRFIDNQGRKFILGVARDVTERESLINALQKSNSDLEQFAYIASHDLKSPLNGIQKVIDWLVVDFGSEVSGELKDKLDLIGNRAQRMKRLLDDLLTYSRLNKQLGDYEWFPLEEVTEQVTDLVDGVSEFTLEFPRGDVFLPKVAFELVIRNLVSNAIKHHPGTQGVIRVRIKEHERFYHMIFSDDGAGIDTRFKEKIFEMFQTLQSRDVTEGSGMGLAIVNKILSHYNGSIELSDSSELGGATFLIVWPNTTHTM